MTKKEHKERHILLHKHLGELLADFITNKGLTEVFSMPLGDLLEWTFKQSQEPDHKP